MRNPDPTAKAFKFAEVEGENLARYLGFNGPQLNINPIHRFYRNVQIEIKELPLDIKGYSKQLYKDRGWTIYINELFPDKEQRMVLLHELYHVQHEQISSDKRDGVYQAQKEHLADAFAEACTMPADLFRKYWEKCKDPRELSDIFFVPENAVKNRALTLGL